MVPYIGILFLIPAIFLICINGRKRRSSRLPPGSLGIPIIGQSLSLLYAMKNNTAEQWIRERAEKYGSVSKLSLFGTPTVLIHGQAANKLVFTSDSSILGNQQPKSIKRILGSRNLFELSSGDHKRVRGAIVSFLKPEVLKQYVGKMDEQVRMHLQSHWEGKQTVTVLPLMKNLTFNIIWSLLFGMEDGETRDKFLENFQQMIVGMWAIPINLPFTSFHKSLKASANVQSMLKKLISEKRKDLEQLKDSPQQDLITCMLSIKSEDKDNAAGLSEKEILDNVMLVMVAGYDTSSIVITFLVRLLATNPAVYASILSEQEQIAKSKASDELLTWEDLTKMKYTWRVAMELLRIIPPVFGGFRKVLKDIEYGGFLIPKGWQIFWAANMTHMDETIFPEPLKFNPARFDIQESTVPPYCFVAFGGGTRICPGFEFARIEILTAVHYLVTRFTWKLCCKDDTFSREPMPTPNQGLPIQLEPKKNVSET